MEPALPIERRIFLIRGQRVMLDADLAAVYGVSTRRLNEQVRRNRKRFPKDFMFLLTPVEKAEVVAKCGHLRKPKHSAKLPYAFTEHGALLVAGGRNNPLTTSCTSPRTPQTVSIDKNLLIGQLYDF